MLQPTSFQFGSDSITVAKLQFKASTEVRTLTEAFGRYSALIFTHQTNPSTSGAVDTVSVNVVSSSEEYPQFDTDESYSLKVPDSSGAGEGIEISAATVYGALRGLESLSQLIVYDFEEDRYVISGAPIFISDTPRYKHRGMLVDTSRHFQPMHQLKRTVDALSYAKYNVLHWHVVDTQVQRV